MKAMALQQTGPLQRDSQPLTLVDQTAPEPAAGEILVKVGACGVCHTELDEIEGRLTPPKLPVVPGHEIIGRVADVGSEVQRFQAGDRIGVGWIFSSTGSLHENLDSEFLSTGCDRNGGYAEYMVVPESYAYPIPESFADDAAAAPLLCAGAIGYRALKLTGIENGQPIGLTGFGGSAHIVLQLVKHLYPESPIGVFARDPESREFSMQLGANWAGATEDRCPFPLQAIIDTTPAWKPVVHALRNLQPGGKLVINAIRKEAGDQEELLSLSYHEDLWMERQIQSVANITHFDIAEFLPIAAEIPIKPRVTRFPLTDANEALLDLKFNPTRGANVLVMD